MQYLRKDFASYYRNSGLSRIVLHGPVGEVKCKLLITPTFVKIGGGSKKFFSLHHLCTNNLGEIFFKVQTKRANRDVKVLYNFF